MSVNDFGTSACPNRLVERYAYFKKLDYFSTECIYSPDAYRGHARVFLKDLEAARPSAIIDIIHSGEAFEVREEVKKTQKAQRMFSLLLQPCPFHLMVYRNMQTMWLYVVQRLMQSLHSARRFGTWNRGCGHRKCSVWIHSQHDLILSKSDKGKKKLEASGPAPDSLRKIPYFELPSGPGPAVAIESVHQPLPQDDTSSFVTSER